MKKSIILLSFIIGIFTTKFSVGEDGGGKTGGQTPAQPGQQSTSGPQSSPVYLGHVYHLKRDIILYYISLGTKGKDTDYIELPKRTRVSITQDSGKLIVGLLGGYGSNCSCTDSLVIFNYRDGKKDRKIKYSHLKNTDSVKNFCILLGQTNFVKDPAYYMNIHFSLVQAGALTIPFKFRPGYYWGKDTIPNEASLSLNINGYVAYVWGHTKFLADPAYTSNPKTLMAGAFLGPTVISLTTVNSRYPTLNGLNEGGITYGIFLSGAIQSFNIGLFIGKDSPVAFKASEWDYSNLTWIGLGVGFNLNTFNSANNNKPFAMD